jgi:hypothetical protein
VVQRGQRHSALGSCQRSYPLSFRGQVCGAQGLLPCFPPTALVPWRLPSLSRVPEGPIPRGRRYYEGATTSRSRNPGRLLVRFRAPRDPSSVRARRMALPDRRRTDPGPDTCSAGCPSAGSLSRGHERDLSGSQAIRPVPLPRSKTPAEPTIPRHWRFRRCCLRSNDSEGFSMRSISRLLRGFSTCCLRFKNGVAATPARLTSGWLAGLCREGVEPSGSR